MYGLTPSSRSGAPKPRFHVNVARRNARIDATTTQNANFVNLLRERRPKFPQLAILCGRGANSRMWILGAGHFSGPRAADKF